MNQTKQENSQLTGISLHPETKVWKALEAEPIYTLYKTIYRDISQAFVFNMPWILLSNATNFKDQNWSVSKWVILPSLSPAHKNGKWESYCLLSEIGPRPQFDTGVYTNTGAGRIPATVWLPPAGKGLPAVPVCVHCQWQLSSPTVPLLALGAALCLVLLKWHECHCLLPWRLLI